LRAKVIQQLEITVTCDAFVFHLAADHILVVREWGILANDDRGGRGCVGAGYPYRGFAGGSCGGGHRRTALGRREKLQFDSTTFTCFARGETRGQGKKREGAETPRAPP